MNRPIPITMANIDEQIEANDLRESRAAAEANGTTFLTEAKTSIQQPPQPS